MRAGGKVYIALLKGRIGHCMCGGSTTEEIKIEAEVQAPNPDPATLQRRSEAIGQEKKKLNSV